MITNKIKGISHVTFVCKDLEMTSHFLKELFDAKEIYSSGDKTFSISKEKFFMIGDLWIAIMEGEPINQTYNHIAFSVDEKSLPIFEAKIKDLGLKILPGRPRKLDEGKSIYFYDYDNHLFELHAGSLEARLELYKEDFKIAPVKTKHDWDEYHNIRIKEIFDRLSDVKYDYNHPSLTDSKNHHYLYYKSNKIIGAAQFELLDSQTAAIRTIAIVGDLKNHGYGKMVEAEIKKHGVKVIRVHANPRAYNFYKHNGYSEMQFESIMMSHDLIRMGKYC